MHVTVEDRTVSENLRAFLELLRMLEARREKQGAALVEKSYRAYLNRKSGKLIFADTHRDQPHFEDHEWKPLYVNYAYDPITESFQAVIYETKEVDEAFRLNDLMPSAIKAIKETVIVLNQLSFLVRGDQSDLITKIKALCKLQIDIGSTDKQRDILVAAWHSVDRIGAEKALRGKPIGTFLFREDSYARVLAQQLTEQLGRKIICITLTILEENNVTDNTLVHFDHAWRVYDDALFCNVQGYSDLQELLKGHFCTRATQPLYHHFK